MRSNIQRLLRALTHNAEGKRYGAHVYVVALFCAAFVGATAYTIAIGGSSVLTGAAGTATVAPSKPPLAVGSWGTPGQQALARSERALGIPYSYSDLEAAIKDRWVRVAKINDVTDLVTVSLRSGAVFSTTYPVEDTTQLTTALTKAGASTTVAAIASESFLSRWLLPLFILLLIGGVAFAVLKGGNKGKISKGFTEARGLVSEKPEVGFADVAGADEAVEELQEMVDFLLHPEPYAKLGAKLPAGAVLYGPPGCGKTLLAKAVAHESQLPFYAVSGADFVELYVGTGAARFRSLFAAARKEGGVIFIDEIDAVGKTRFSHGGNDERDHALTQLLVEMDGFNGRERVIVIAATNRLDSLDPALLRPGRFTRQIHVGAPTAEGRHDILCVHARSKPLDESVDLRALADSSAGATGAVLAEALNEAALMAARGHSSVITHKHLREGLLRVIAGPRKLSSMLAAGERNTIAYHEAGHALCAELCPTCDPVQHVTINPRGQAAGFALIGLTDRSLRNEQDIHEQLIYVLGGRAAEYELNGTVSSGAANDLMQANELARTAVEEWGLSPVVGHVISGPRGLSEDMRGKTDSEVRRLVEDAYRDAVVMVREHRQQLDALANTLLAAGDVERPEIVAAMHGTVPQPRHPQVRHQPVPLPVAIGGRALSGRWRLRQPLPHPAVLAAFASLRRRYRTGAPKASSYERE